VTTTMPLQESPSSALLQSPTRILPILHSLRAILR